jgi:hypothetical protein
MLIPINIKKKYLVSHEVEISFIFLIDLYKFE